ncbi:hypothetical protein FRC14_004486 [Serendipita sp. 396]|nr:hypothetical protein FRC14_004486 [Serendipita sp. 396]KAG8781893.1 hypothetical protein FRC15_007934 [Serendipita sp. 397]KAG8798202.1 hypothetical protein FRC16_007741 [Serendipita sp. 398]KAG8862879.1 hypothetical protein FRC20_010976 [Serendipita sp. 405]
MSKRRAEREPQSIKESKLSKEPSSSSYKAPTVNGKVTSPGAPSSSPKIALSQATLDTVNGAISKPVELTANLRNARNDRPRSVLGKRRDCEDEENVEIETTSKRRRTRFRDSGPEDHTTNVIVRQSIPSRETVGSSSPFIPGGSPTSRQHSDCHQLDTNQTGGIIPTDLSVLPFHLVEDKRNPLANTASPSLNLWLYDAAWTALHAYKELVNCGSTAESVSEARESMYLAWSTWSEARVEPPTLLWLYHTGQGLNSEGRYTIARAMNFDGADKNLTESIPRWIEKGPHPLAQIQDPPGPCSSVEATENRMPRLGNPKALVPVPEEMIADGKLPNWARCCLYSNSKASLEAHLAQNPALLKKKQETKITKMLFDTDGNERFSVDKRGRKMMISEGTRAYHSLPADQKMVILDG